MEPIHLTDLHTHELKILAHRLKQYAEELTPTLRKNHEVKTHTSWLTYVWYFCSFIIVIYILKAIIQCLKIRKEKARHAPYRQIPLEAPPSSSSSSCTQCFTNCFIVKAITNCTRREECEPTRENIQFENLTKPEVKIKRKSAPKSRSEYSL